MPVENTWRETGSDQKEKAGLSQHVPESIMLSKLKKSQSAQKSRRLAANTVYRQNRWKKGKTQSEIFY